jgi:hypothetical protein
MTIRHELGPLSYKIFHPVDVQHAYPMSCIADDSKTKVLRLTFSRFLQVIEVSLDFSKARTPLGTGHGETAKYFEEHNDQFVDGAYAMNVLWIEADDPENFVSVD